MLNALDQNSQSTRSTSASIKLKFSIKLLSLGFIIFFGGAIVSILLGLDQPLLQSDTGRFLLRLVRWGALEGGGQHYELMISTVYFVWGIFLWHASAAPLSHKLFLDFTIVANVAHFGLMFGQSLLMHGEHLHLMGDVSLGWAGLVPLIIFWLPERSKAH